MGTRGALCFVVDGVEKTIYNHFDSYPDGLGVDVLGWIRSVLESGCEDVTASTVRSLKAVDENAEPTEGDRTHLAAFADHNVSTGKDWYSLLRGTQGDPAAIMRAGHYCDAADFPLDSLFCEWAYVVDFDARQFEAYRGFQHEPTTEGRWAGREQASQPSTVGPYYPVQRVAAWNFDELPDAQAFVAATRSEL